MTNSGDDGACLVLVLGLALPSRNAAAATSAHIIIGRTAANLSTTTSRWAAIPSPPSAAVPRPDRVSASSPATTSLHAAAASMDVGANTNGGGGGGGGDGGTNEGEDNESDSNNNDKDIFVKWPPSPQSSAVVEDGEQQPGGRRRINTRVRTFMAMITDRHDSDEVASSISSSSSMSSLSYSSSYSKPCWKKTRSYLYHAAGTKLSAQQVGAVLDFLDLHLPPAVARTVLQQTPRIVGKPVDSYLQPTAEFLRQLWGPELFVLAIERNPGLLLSRGVGYSPAASGRQRRRRRGSDAEITIGRNNSNSNSSAIIINAASDDDTACPDRHAAAAPPVVAGEFDDVGALLEEFMGMSPTSIQRLKRSAPFVFGLATEKVRSVLVFLQGVLSEELAEVSWEDGSSGVGQPADRAAVVSAILCKVIGAHPHLLNLSVETNLKPRLDFLARECRMNATHLATLVKASNGSVLGLSVENNLKPTLDYLRQEIFHEDEMRPPPDQELELELERDQLRKCILSHPSLLGLSRANLQAKVSFFRSIGPTVPHRIAHRCPSVYSLNLQRNILPTVQFLAKVWGASNASNVVTTTTKTTTATTTKSRTAESGSPADQVSVIFVEPDKKLEQMLYEYPNILTLSVEGNIRPTMNFFNRTGYIALNDDWELQPSNPGRNDDGPTTDPTSAVASHASADPPTPTTTSCSIRGRYIAASLYNRLLPRWHFSLSAGAATGTNDGSDAGTGASATATSPSSSSSPPLHVLVMASDEAFCEAMGLKHDAYLTFKEKAIPRLKFSSQFDTWLKTGRPIEL